MFGVGLAMTAGADGLTEAAGVTIVAAAGTWAVSSLLRLRGKCRRVAHTLASAGNAKLVEPEAIAQAAPKPLAAALGDALAAARRGAVDAEHHAKELEVRLKIADAEREHAQAIIYSISDAVMVTDPCDDVVLANESAARTFKFDLDQAPHTPVRQLVRDPKMLELIRQVRQAGGKGGRRIVEHQVQCGDTTKTYKVTLSPVTDAPEPGEAPKSTEEGAGVVAVLHDVTHEREIAQLKNDFVSNVSHELRTPLASIKAYVELLIDGEAQDERAKREFYEVIQNEANRLGRLIDNILNISKIESGLVKIDRRPQALTAVIRDAIEMTVPQAERRQITISDDLTAASYQALVDRDMMYQAVLNLLSNAVKYTPVGGVVRVNTAIDEARRKVIVRISDTGSGIPPKDLPFIFDKFYRAESNKGMAQGNGLGLPLVKHVIETVHYGRLFVDSQSGKGSSFGFELDLCD